MNEVIKRHAEFLYGIYSCVIGIWISIERSENNKMLIELSIVFLCLDQFILPYMYEGLLNLETKKVTDVTFKNSL